MSTVVNTGLPKGSVAQRQETPTPDAWDTRALNVLINELSALRASILDREKLFAPALAGVDAAWTASGRNLVHYVGLRRFDLRSVQEELARLGLSSLGRSESHALANLDKVLGLLHKLTGRPWVARTAEEPVGRRRGRTLLDLHTQALLGPPPRDRAVRIMVTLPSDASHDYALVKGLVDAGMDVARVNCAHDGADEWRAMAALVKRAAHDAGRRVRVLVDLGGPKLRTDGLRPGPAVLKLRPRRDELGRVVAPAFLGLRSDSAGARVAGAVAHATVDARWLAQLRRGDEVRLTDARGAKRKLTVERCDAAGALLTCRHTAYLVPDTRLRLHGKGRRAESGVADLPWHDAFLLVHRGDTLWLTHPERVESTAELGGPRQTTHTIGCSLPEVFGQVQAGERIWFDDGRIGGVVRGAFADGLQIEITNARDGGDKLAGDKGINLPDSDLDLAAPTKQDLEDLEAVVRCADMIGLSFVQTPADVDRLRRRLDQLGASQLGIVLKIETRRGFDNLPGLLLAAMKHHAAGVMIARGDLAVECGYERLAEVQEEILWACEAAHMPVIWATQVLDSLARTGRPSRSEITDAAMGERAECVMLNKGPFILDAMRTLDDILRRMQSHQSKKRPLLRALSAWGAAPDDIPATLERNHGKAGARARRADLAKIEVTTAISRGDGAA